MSLLMEALRKAEEAKSKASQEEKDKPGAKASAADAGKPDQGPIVINPDPDEEETLASHTLESSLELVEMEPDPEPEPEPDEFEADDFENFEYTPPPEEPEPQQEPGEAVAADSTDTTATDNVLDTDEEDDGLSLLQSSYFTRTQNTGSSYLDDDDLDSPDINDLADEPVTEPESEPVSEQEVVASQPETDTPDKNDRDEKKTLEKANRQSAGALFQAKEDSQRRRMKKLVSIAAVVLVFPLAGIVFWLFTSLNSGPAVQFNVPAGGNVATRSFSDSFGQQEQDATLQESPELAQQDADGQGLAETAAPEADGDSTAATLIALADNTVAEPQATITPEPRTTPPPVPVPQQSQAAPEPEPEPAQPAQTITAATTAVQPAGNATAVNPGTTQGQGAANRTGLTFARTETARVINPDLVAAYESYQQADYATAGRLYQQVLATEPNNRDALLQLASVYLNQNNPAMARNLYTRLLELNPRDPLARAGILETVQGDPVRQESELKSLVTAFPGTPQLSFALGNLYAKQNRWSEAQSAYFDALLAAKSNNTGPVSPDYAFNLAVSLERISQFSSALDYYREAETLSRTSRPGFDPALLQQRLTYLEQRLR